MGPAATARQATPAPRPSGQIALASQTPWVTEGGPFELRLDVAAVSRPEALEVAVTVHQAVTSRSQFQETLEDTDLGNRLWERAVPLTELAFDQGGALRIDLPAALPASPPDLARLPALDPGVYPVAVELRSLEGGPRLDGFTTHLVRVADDGDAEPLEVAWLQPFSAPPARRPDGRVKLDEETRRRLGALAQALAAHPQVPLTLAPTPETLDSLRADGGESVVSTLAGALAGRQVAPGPYVDVDLDALVSAGLSSEVAAQLDRGSRTVESALGVETRRRALVGADAAAPALAVAADAGFERVVLPEEDLVPLGRRLTVANPFTLRAGGAELEAVAADTGLSAHLSGGEPALSAHHLLADLAVLFFDSPGTSRRGVVVRPTPGASPSPALVEVVLSALATNPVPMLEPVTLDTLFDQVPPLEADGGPLARRLVSSASTKDAEDALPAAEMATARTTLDSFVTMVGPGQAEADGLDRLLLVAQASNVKPEQRQAYLEGFNGRRASTIDMVSVVDRGSYRLTAREGTIPLTVVNRNPFPVEVTLALDSDKLQFLDPGPEGGEGDRPGRRVIRRRLAQENTAVPVKVRARTSGAFPLLVSVSSPDGRTAVASSRVTVRATATSGVGLVLSLGAMGFLALWWGRQWRRTRRRPRLRGRPGR